MDGAIVVGVPFGFDSFGEHYALDVVREGRVRRLAWLLAHVPDKQVAMLIVTRAATQTRTYLERGVDVRLSKAACERAKHGCLWMLKGILEPPGAAMGNHFFAGECPVDRLTLVPHQQA